MKKIEKVVQKYVNAEFELIALLNELNDAGTDCSCVYPDRVTLIEPSSITSYEIVKRCINCGGYVKGE